jgi:hypothetical protein
MQTEIEYWQSEAERQSKEVEKWKRLREEYTLM